MKKYGIFAAVVVLTLALMTGCRNPNIKPTELPPTTGAVIMPTTEATTMPSSAPTTVPPADTTDTTGDATEGGETGSATDDTAGARNRIPGMK